MNSKTIVAASVAGMLALPTYALSSQKSPAILVNIDTPNVQMLKTDEINTLRGEYFNSYGAALKFCVLSYPGCSGPIEQVLACQVCFNRQIPQILTVILRA